MQMRQQLKIFIPIPLLQLVHHAVPIEEYCLHFIDLQDQLDL
jgi:hypothetical protein